MLARVVAALVLAVALAGCLDPFRAHVDADTLQATGLDWETREFGVDGEGWFGQKSTETRYTYDPSNTPPFPAVLQLFSIRQGGRVATDDLLELAMTVVDDATSREGIRLDDQYESDGERVLDSGARSKWFTRGGTVRSGDLFAQESTVKILGEVWYDGRSKTGVLAVGLAQVTMDRPFPLDPVQNERSWNAIAGDPSGTVLGARSNAGMVYHTVSHD